MRSIVSIFYSSYPVGNFFPVRPFLAGTYQFPALFGTRGPGFHGLYVPDGRLMALEAYGK
jgi:hypothetical protein